jgi:hypothetical protein
MMKSEEVEGLIGALDRKADLLIDDRLVRDHRGDDNAIRPWAKEAASRLLPDAFDWDVPVKYSRDRALGSRHDDVVVGFPFHCAGCAGPK